MPPHNTQQPRLHAPARPSCNVLCADADDDSRLLIAEILYEYDVDFALTADDAVQLAYSRAYDLCFVDPALPGFSELLIPQLRLFNADLPVVMCIGSRARTCYGAAIHAILHKPLSALAVRTTAMRELRTRPCSVAQSPTGAVAMRS